VTADLDTSTGQGLGNGEPVPGEPRGEAAVAPLTGRVVRGAGWVFASRVVSRGLGMVKIVVLARLLSPEDFGLFGIVMLAIATLEGLTQTGFNTALIHRKENTRDYLDTAWTIQVIRGLALAAALFAAAPAVAWFFAEPRAARLLRVMCASVVLGGCVNVGIVYFRKELEFHKQVFYTTSVAVLSLAVGVALAFRLRSVWALVWAGLAAAGFRCVLSYLVHPYRPRLRLEGKALGELISFGKWVFAYSIVIFLVRHGDDAFVGKLLGAAALGVYQVAYRLSGFLTVEVTELCNAVLMPAYAKLQDEAERLKAAFLRSFGLVFTVVLPVTVLIVGLARSGVLVALGPAWDKAVVPLQFLAAAGFLRAVFATGKPVLFATGRPRGVFLMDLPRLLVMAACIYPLTLALGVGGAGAAVMIGAACMFFVWTSTRRSVGIRWAEVLRRCRPGLVLSVAFALGLLGGALVPAGSPLTELLARGGGAAVLGAFTLFVVEGRQTREAVKQARLVLASALRPQASADA
jgi:O-antigen/teichoic acid export membrane protein